MNCRSRTIVVAVAFDFRKLFWLGSQRSFLTLMNRFVNLNNNFVDPNIVWQVLTGVNVPCVEQILLYLAWHDRCLLRFSHGKLFWRNLQRY